MPKQMAVSSNKVLKYNFLKVAALNHLTLRSMTGSFRRAPYL